MKSIIVAFGLLTSTVAFADVVAGPCPEGLVDNGLAHGSACVECEPGTVWQRIEGDHGECVAEDQAIPERGVGQGGCSGCSTTGSGAWWFVFVGVLWCVRNRYS